MCPRPWSTRITFPALLLALAVTAPQPAAAQAAEDDDAFERAHAAMADAARAFIASLSPPSRLERAVFPFDDEARMTWAYIPGVRAGLPLSDMTAEQRRRVHDLLRTALSQSGYLKVTGIMQLEEILRAIESSGMRRSVDHYTVAIFGDPGGAEPWGWRFEGHHISLNFTSVERDGLSTTPLFLGSNPGEVRAGPLSGLRVLAAEEDLGRQLIRGLPRELRDRAVVSATAPTDILTRNDPVARELPMEGLPAGDMAPSDRLLLIRLLEVYARNLEPAIAEARLAAIRENGIDRLHFVWMGSTEPGEPHYYRIHGPTVLIEYDNVQNNANHIHTVWRDLENDFGLDLLRLHYEHSSHHQH